MARSTQPQIRMLRLGGSLSTSSTSVRALALALAGARGAGAETTLLDLRTLALPPYDPWSGTSHPAVQRLLDEVSQAQGLLWSSRLYHGPISGSFKTALDWLDLLEERRSPYLTYTVVGLISTAGGTQGLQAINTVEFVVRALRGWTVPLVVPISEAWRVFDEHGKIQDPQLEARLHQLGAKVVCAARRF